MKARIAKLEGENRASKRLQQGSETRIKMLEMALKRERCVDVTLLSAPPPRRGLLVLRLTLVRTQVEQARCLGQRSR